MLPEDDEVVQVDHVHDVFRVVLLQELQDLQLNTGLVVILLLVLDDLDCDIDARLMVEALEGRSKRALAKE